MTEKDKLNKRIKELEEENNYLEVLLKGYREQLKTKNNELDYIKNSITDKIKHQKTKIGEKALKEVIEDYNEWMLGHKIGL